MKDQPRPLVLYHANCQDGWAAAWAAWTKLGDAADYQPANYGDDPPDVAGRDVYVLDFSWKRKHMLDMATVAKSLTCLDHHKTAEQELAGLEHPSFRCVFDMKKCGARLAWEYFRPGEPAPFLIDLVQDRDLWTWKLPESRALNAWLGVQERNFGRWTWIAGRLKAPVPKPGGVKFGKLMWPVSLEYDSDCRECVEQGQAILTYQQEVINSHVRQATEREVAGHRVLVANVTTLVSEITGELAQDRPFGATYRDELGRGLRIWSLRSREGGIDVSEIARSMGGGGHKQAAGFQEVLT